MTKKGDCFLLSDTSLYFLCEIGPFLSNIVIFHTSFVQGQFRIFAISIVTYECTILMPQKLLFGVCNRY